MTEKTIQKVSGAIFFSAFCTLMLFLVIAVTYALYLFLKTTRLPDIAGIHFSKSISLQVQSMEGELYSNKEKGIENWLILKDEKNGFQIKYPNDWEKQDLSDGKILKVYNKEKSGMQSLSMTISAERRANFSEGMVKDIFKEKGIDQWQPSWADEIMNSQEKTRTGLIKGSDGIYREFIFWKTGNDLVFLEGVFYNEKKDDLNKNFENVVSEFSII